MKTWLITGISSGLGRSVAEILLRRGDRVAGTARKLDVLQEMQKKWGVDKLWFAPLDLANMEAIRPFVDEAFRHFGSIDVVVNNAGYGLFGAAEEVSDEQVKHQLDTNLVGSIQVVRAVLPHLRAQSKGRIIQISSTGGQFAFPNFGLYHASKWGVEGFIETVRQEVAPFGIECTIVEPGATGTNFGASLVRPPIIMHEYDGTPAGEVRRAMAENKFPLPGDANKVAQAIVDCAEQEPAPLRVPLGSDTYELLRKVYQERLANLEAGKQVALAVDKDS